MTIILKCWNLPQIRLAQEIARRVPHSSRPFSLYFFSSFHYTDGGREEEGGKGGREERVLASVGNFANLMQQNVRASGDRADGQREGGREGWGW